MFLLFWLNILTIIYRMELILSRNVINFYCNMQEKTKLDNYYPNIIIKQYSHTQKIIKQMSHTSSYFTYHKD